MPKSNLIFALIVFLGIPATGFTQDDSVDRLRQDLVEVAHRMYDFRLVVGIGGDVSARVGDTETILIKQTGTSLGDMPPRTLVHVDFDGNVLQGTDLPAGETAAYLEIYKARPDIRAILHTHAPYATAFASTGKLLPLVTFQARNYIGKIDRIPYFPIRSEPFIKAVSEKFRDPDLTALIFGNHGFMVVGPDIFTAL